MKDNLRPFLKTPLAQSGFTLVEVAIVMIIGATLLAAFSSGYLVYVTRNKISTTVSHIEEIRQAIENYALLNGGYPCPAAPNAPLNTPAFGTATACAGGPAISAGNVPSRTLSIPDDFTQDGWGNRILYVVTTALTNAAPPPPAGTPGAISAQDGNGNSIVQPPNTAHYVLVSAGADSIGANVFATGVQTSACAAPPGAPPPGLPIDLENCDGDNLFFRSALFTNDYVYVRGVTGPQNPIPSGATLMLPVGSPCPVGSGWTAAAAPPWDTIPTYTYCQKN